MTSPKIKNKSLTIHHQKFFFLQTLYQALYLLLTAFKEDTLFFIKWAQAWIWADGGIHVG
jgi:hypothetical protein